MFKIAQAMVELINGIINLMVNINLNGLIIIKADMQNGGGQLRERLNMTGGSTAGYFNWSDVINEMGVLNFTFNNVFSK